MENIHEKIRFNISNLLKNIKKLFHDKNSLDVQFHSIEMLSLKSILKCYFDYYSTFAKIKQTTAKKYYHFYVSKKLFG